MAKVKQFQQVNKGKEVRKMEKGDRLLRLRQVLELVPVSKSTLWNWTRQGKFPAPVRLSRRTTCWKLSDVEKFIEKGGLDNASA